MKVTLWVKPAVKGELERLANQQRAQEPEARLTLSATGGALLERAVQQHVDMQYGALLEPVMRKIIRDKNRAFRGDLVWLLLRIAFDIGQTRSLATNMLNRQPGMSDDLFKTIVKESAAAAKRNIFRRSPHMADLLAMAADRMGGEEGSARPSA